MRAPTQAQLYRALIAYDETLATGPATTSARILAMRAALVAAAHPPVEKAACCASQEQDEMACGKCGLRWDVADTDPPRCGRAAA